MWFCHKEQERQEVWFRHKEQENQEVFESSDLILLFLLFFVA